MSEQTKTASREEPLGRSTPYSLKRIVAFYLILITAVLITAVLFVVRGVMDVLEIVLAVITLACAVVGLGRLLFLSRQPVTLYDSYFTVGAERYDDEQITKLECSLQQVRFRTGSGRKDRHAFLAGNAEALVYLMKRRQSELRREKKRKK